MTSEEVEAAFEDLRNGRIGVDGIAWRFRDDGDAMLRLAHMYRDGDMVNRSPEVCEDYLYYAVKAGCREAGWELLESPQLPDERLDFMDRRYWAVREMLFNEEITDCGGNILKRCVRDDEAFEEAERRSVDHPEIAAAVVCGCCLDTLEEYDRWRELAGDAFLGDVTYMVATRHLDAGDTDTGITLLARAASAGSADAHFDLGIRRFLGAGVMSSIFSAKRHFESAEQLGCERPPTSWLAMFEDLPDTEPGEGSAPAERDGEDGRHPFRIRCGRDDIPEADVLSDICALARRCDADGRGGRVGAASGFLYCSDSWDDNRHPPNYCFLPTGFEAVWKAGMHDGIRMNRCLGLTDVRRLMRLSIQTAMVNMRRGDAV